ncbi:MAG TPA: hypothetical protein VL688_06035 [Verrucomicrobiae bacterium]|jgi:hypothetical protein|nr:hypothetical protein [Verrucomicrobiae bacterium]
MKREFAVLACILAFSGCASAGKTKAWQEDGLYYSVYASEGKKSEKRQEILKQHSEWPEDVRQNVQKGIVTAGMTEDQALSAYGKPLEILESKEGQSPSEANADESKAEPKEHALWLYPETYLVLDDGVVENVEDVMKIEVKHSLIDKIRNWFH